MLNLITKFFLKFSMHCVKLEKKNTSFYIKYKYLISSLTVTQNLNDKKN